MKKLLSFAAAGFLALSLASPASAHFMMMYTPEIAKKQSSDVDMRLIFTHPAEAGLVMDMGGIQEFYMVSQRGDDKPKKVDLKEFVKEIQWKNPESTGPAFSAKIPRATVRSLGDYVFALVPGYYYEEGEGIYIQQITKLVLNAGGIPSNWAEPLGLPAEIVPLAKPYALWAGNIFQGQVLSDGKPVPGAEIEVEYMGHTPDLATNSMPAKGTVEYPQTAFVTQTIIADGQGYFTYGLPKAGWWGFAAMGVGPKKEHKGKPLSQDAVLWVKAADINQ